MISHEFQCIFVHIPKCAGTSIERRLGHHTGYVGRNAQDHRSIRLMTRPRLEWSALTQKLFWLDVARGLRQQLRTDLNPNNKIVATPTQFAQYFKFAFVRNPWARAYSLYRNVLRDDRHKQALHISGTPSFSEFMQAFAGKGMLRPQTYWIDDLHGEMAMDFIGRFENLQGDFDEACRLMGLPSLPLPHSIQGDGGDYRQHYDQATRDLVQSVYREEIERFGYSFDGADTPVVGGDLRQASMASGGSQAP